MGKWLIVGMVLLFLIMPFVSSAPPVNPTTQISVNSMQVESPNIPLSKIGDAKRFHAHVINSTASKTNKTTTCALHVYNSTGWDIPTGTQWMEFEDYNGIDFAMTIEGGNFTKAGYYAYVIQCNSSNEIGFYRGQFLVTPNGESADEGTAIFYVGMIAVLLFFLAICIYLFMEGKGLNAKVGSLGFGYLLLIAITFIAWHMVENFLTSAPFLIDMFRILFFVLIIGFFPLVIGGFAYYVIMLFKIKEIERLMGKGIGEDEAMRRTGGKFR